MVFVQRDETNTVIGVYANIQPGVAEEERPDNHPDVVAFLNPVASIETVKVAAAQRIDADAEAARLRYITGGSGQAMTYQQKAAEAAAALAATDPDPADYPLIVAEIGITAPTLLEVATVIDGAYQQWRVVGAAIEALRLGGKAAVAAAMTVEDVQAAADITWP